MRQRETGKNLPKKTGADIRGAEEPEAKKSKREFFELETEMEKFVNQDTANGKIWDECRDSMARLKIAFLKTVAERLTCACCWAVIHNPVSTPCAHNLCLNCLKRSFRADVQCCPTCRYPMRKHCKMPVNKPLSSALKLLFAGYGGGR